MNLKESYRYQNKLQNLLLQVQNYLVPDPYCLTNNSNPNITKTIQKHLRTKANPNAEDEEIDLTKERKIAYPVNVIGDFAMHLLGLKEQLTEAITEAKRNKTPFDIDSAISNNKMRQSLADTFKKMCDIRSSERIIEGVGYTFNNEGNQVSYKYDIKETTTIDFDRNKFKKMFRKLMKQSDEVSNQLDKIQVDVEVDFEPPYDVNDSFEDILEQYVETYHSDLKKEE